MLVIGMALYWCESCRKNRHGGRKALFSVGGAAKEDGAVHCPECGGRNTYYQSYGRADSCWVPK